MKDTGAHDDAYKGFNCITDIIHATTEIFDHDLCDIDTECNNPVFSQDTPAYDDLPNLVWLQMNY